MNLEEKINTCSSLGQFTNTISTQNLSTYSNTMTSYSSCPEYSGTWHYHNCFNYDNNKTEKSYKIIRALIKINLVKIKDLNHFFDLMDEVIKII